MSTDIAIWSIGPDGSFEAEAIPSRKIAGIEKLVQHFIIGLLTPSGSLTAYEEFGTDFVPLLYEQGVGTAAIIQHAFGIAERQLAPQLITQDTEPAAKYLHSAIDDVSIYGSSVIISVTIYNAEGDSKQVSFSVTLEQGNGS